VLRVFRLPRSSPSRHPLPRGVAYEVFEGSPPPFEKQESAAPQRRR